MMYLVLRRATVVGFDPRSPDVKMDLPQNNAAPKENAIPAWSRALSASLMPLFFRRSRFLLPYVPVWIVCAALSSLAVRASSPPGQVVSWGSVELPHFDPEMRLNKIASGGSHNLAVTSDGTVVAWGGN